MSQPILPPQFKTWKDFWMALSPEIRDPENHIRSIRVPHPETFSIFEYRINEIKEGVFQEAIALHDPEDFTYNELCLIRHELMDLNVQYPANEVRKSALEKVQNKLYSITYPEK